MILPMQAGWARPSAAPGTVTRFESADRVWHHITCPCGCRQVFSAAHRVVSGSVETGDLTLDPSLFMSAPGACGWHGFLIGGMFRHASLTRTQDIVDGMKGQPTFSLDELMGKEKP